MSLIAVIMESARGGKKLQIYQQLPHNGLGVERYSGCELPGCRVLLHMAKNLHATEASEGANGASSEVRFGHAKFDVTNLLSGAV